MRRALLALVIALALLAGVLVLRAATMRSHQVAAQPVAPVALDEDALAARLAGALRIPTESHQDPAQYDAAAFADFHRYLEEHYPLAHATLEREKVGDSLLYTWRGSDPSLPPIVLAAHQDVVPIDPGSEGDWTQPPYGGVVADGFVWGRGALDDKLNVLGQLEAVEALLREGVVPARTVYLAYGHDEEVGGNEGAARMAARLAERGVAPMLVLDEGGSILQGLLPGVDAPVAVIGIAEKGYTTLELEVVTPGGHSSTPPAETAIGILAAAVARLEANPFPARLQGPSRALFEEGVGPEAAFPYRLLYANLWLFGPLLERVLGGVPAASASIRTTTAPTIFEAGVKDNVLPSRAHAKVNFRTLPGDTKEDVVAHARAVIDDERVRITPSPKQREASEVSRVGGPGWELLARSLRETWPGTVVAPYLMIAGSDARHYLVLGDVVYRHMPIPLDVSDTRRIHGTDERVSVRDYAGLVRTYRRLLENAVVGP